MSTIDQLVSNYLQRHDPYSPPPVGKRLRDVSRPTSNEDLDTAPSGSGGLGGSSGNSSSGNSSFPVEDGAWTGLAILAACIMFIVLGLEYTTRDNID